MADPAWGQVFDRVRLHVGAYLTNTRRDVGHCAICASPIEARWDICGVCRNRGRSGDNHADSVICLAYGGHTPQSRKLLYDYKEAWNVSPDYPGFANREEMYLVETLLSGLVGHRACHEATVGKFDALACVPSTKARTVTRLDSVADLVASVMGIPRINIKFAGTAGSGNRVVAPANYLVGLDVAGLHVLLIDDTWVSGARAQSVAGALKAAGAMRVTILTAGRWLDASWAPSEPYFAQAAILRYDPAVCPATSVGCP